MPFIQQGAFSLQVQHLAYNCGYVAIIGLLNQNFGPTINPKLNFSGDIVLAGGACHPGGDKVARREQKKFASRMRRLASKAARPWKN